MKNLKKESTKTRTLDEYILIRIDPLLHNFELDGYDKTIEDFKRQLKIIVADGLEANRAVKLTELLPCPFCGSEAEIVKNSFPPRNRNRHPSCSNENCIAYVEEQDEQGGTNVDFYTEEEAIKLWNKRA